MTVINLHGIGNRIRCKHAHASETFWLSVPLSADGTANVDAFLTVEDCDRIAAELRAVADRVRRMRAIADEAVCP